MLIIKIHNSIGLYVKIFNEINGISQEELRGSSCVKKKNGNVERIFTSVIKEWH